MASNALHGIPNRQFLGDAVQAIPDRAAILDTDGTILSLNAAWQDAADGPDDPLCPPDVGIDYLAALEAAGERTRRVATGLEAVLQGDRDQFECERVYGSSDRRQSVSTRVAPFVCSGTRYVTVTHTEPTACHESRTGLRETLEVITTSELSFEGTLDRLLEVGRDVVGSECAALARASDDEYVAEMVVGPDADTRRGKTIPVAALHSAERGAGHGETLALEDTDAHGSEFPDSASDIGSYLGVPVLVEGNVEGVVCFYSTAPRTDPFPARAVTFVVWIAEWVGQELERRGREETLQQLKENITEVVWISSPEKDEMKFISDSYGDVWGRPPETLLREPTSFVDAIHPDDRDRVQDALAAQQTNPDAYEETYRIVQPDGEIRWIHDRSSGVYTDDGLLQSIVGIATDITQRKEHEQELARQRDELAQLERLNALVRHITQALHDVPTRDAIETAVCERLTESDLYEAVWTGTRDESDDNDPVIIPQTTVDVTEETRDVIPARESALAQTALETGEVHIIDDVGAVPLMTGDTTYGVMVVYAPPTETISDAERVVLADLGTSIALAIQRVHSQRSLTAETAVAVNLRASDPEVIFGEVATDLGCSLTLDQRVVTSEDQTIYYITVDGAAPETVSERLGRGEVVADCDVVRDSERSETGLVEVHLAEGTRLPIDILTDYGGSVTSAEATERDISLSVELPPTVNVRTVVDDLTTIMPGLRIVSKRHVDRPTQSMPAVQEQIRDGLTQKQEAALRAAYARGYYRWPRDSTIEDIAEIFDVTPSTLNYRLRKAQGAVVTALFAGERARDGQAVP